MAKTIRFTLNGEPTSVTTDGDRMLLWVLRTELALTGTKFGCGEGFCGSCSVLVDGRVERSCQLPLDKVAGADVITIEGLADGDDLHPLQQAFVEHDALQCGFCTPGMIMNAAALLQKEATPSRERIVDAMEDNLCRCGAHRRIVAAIETAASRMAKRVKS
ncbi:MAG: (2Fe-2S)-binding protein [Holophagae bacterium]|jgi:carbon-monoxide dehydrogenase small subunit